MNVNFNKVNKKVYFVFYDNEIDVNLFLKNSENKVFVNFNIQNSIIVNTYFRKKKLRFISNSIKSFSNAPQEVFSVVVDLTKKNTEIVMGTAGLSYDSIAAIYFELKCLLQNTKKVVFICHQRKIKKGDYEIFEEEFLHENDIVDLFLNS